MYRLLFAALLAVSFAAPAQSVGSASWTGRAIFITFGFSNQPAVKCEYRMMNGQLLWQVFPGNQCPAVVNVY